jgi:hypothetical protein
MREISKQNDVPMKDSDDSLPDEAIQFKTIKDLQKVNQQLIRNVHELQTQQEKNAQDQINSKLQVR